MGSVCCTSSRAGDISESVEDWSMEQNAHANVSAVHGALSPPPYSTRWDRRPHFSELAASYNGMLTHRTASSSSRSYRSNSISSESRATASHRSCETSDGLLAVFNSPSESFRHSHHFLDNIANSTYIPSEALSRKHTAQLSQEDSGLSVPSTKAVKEFLVNKNIQNFSKLDLLASTHNVELSLHSMAEGCMNRMTSTRFHPYQQMLRNSLDGPLTIPRQKSGSWKSHGFPDLADSHPPRTSRWSKMDMPSNMVTDSEQDFPNEFYIGSTPVNLDPIAPQVESPKCELCAKAISQKSFSSFSKALGSKELPVVGILECGHVYHAECLDQATPTTQARDPPCPRCENEKRAKIKIQEVRVGKARTIEHLFLKGKVSRVGISVEDFSDCERSNGFQPMQCQSGVSESSGRKGGLPGAQNADKSFITKSLLRRQFSLRGKGNRDASGSSFGSKRPGYAARVLPENSTRDYNSGVGEKIPFS